MDKNLIYEIRMECLKFIRLLKIYQVTYPEKYTKSIILRFELEC